MEMVSSKLNKRTTKYNHFLFRDHIDDYDDDNDGILDIEDEDDDGDGLLDVEVYNTNTIYVLTFKSRKLWELNFISKILFSFLLCPILFTGDYKYHSLSVLSSYYRSLRYYSCIASPCLDIVHSCSYERATGPGPGNK